MSMRVMQNRLTRMRAKEIMKKMMVRLALSIFTTSSASKSVYSVFALRTIIVQPVAMQNMADKSYLQMNYSSRITMEKKIAATMDVDEFAASKVKSRYCTR